jgi:outer membrane protein W
VQSWVRHAAVAAALMTVVLASSPAESYADASGADSSARWWFHTRAIISGDSHESAPANYKAYSGIAIEAALRRVLGARVAAELSLHTESREIDHLNPGAPADRLGSLEMLPATLVLLYRFWTGGSFHPYAGAGVTLTLTWEKSGVLDSLDVPAHFGPAVQLGFDKDLGRTVLFNFDLRWNTLQTDIENHGAQLAQIKIDPITLGAGIGFRF